MNRAVFLDRDGTLNYDSRDYIKNVAEFQLFPNTVVALKKLYLAGFKLIVITNQACVAKGLTTIPAVEEIHQLLREKLSEAGIELAGIYYCPHDPEAGCDCRKPRIGNVLLAARELGISLADSYFVGDSHRDVEAGHAAGCRTILVTTGIRQSSYDDIAKWQVQPDYVVLDLLTAAEMILTLERNTN
ncbi:MAG TPA: HAD family hydrolase [Candidatus Marinimicrobia bacterium]|nr:HAD family hydrolase [Candidatus Neomarinimicrobiota bacterium]HRS51511.1 HAD family hydrolase [Candidatus Neomarinimicrobiota bacterium]HRU93352.1 HAD family hydrolase [Candidatus Neomarinimicrobiota bacterium]